MYCWGVILKSRNTPIRTWYVVALVLRNVINLLIIKIRAESIHEH